MEESIFIKEKIEVEKAIFKAQKGDECAYSYLIKTFKPSILGISKKYYLPGGEKEDLFQVGLIGLYEGVLSYNPNLNSNAISYLKLCINREIVDTIRTFTRQKHTISNEAISTETIISTDNNSILTLSDILSTEEDTLDKKLLEQESIANIYTTIKLLSKVESDVLSMYCTGYSQKEISRFLKLDIKKIDNALQRSKKKMRTLISECN